MKQWLPVDSKSKKLIVGLLKVNDFHCNHDKVPIDLYGNHWIPPFVKYNEKRKIDYNVYKNYFIDTKYTTYKFNISAEHWRLFYNPYTDRIRIYINLTSFYTNDSNFKCIKNLYPTKLLALEGFPKVDKFIINGKDYKNAIISYQ